MSYHLAQINIGRLIAPLDDPRIAGFVNGLDPVNALADAAPGFIWRLQSESGNATDIEYSSDDPTMMVNMSVWDSVEALHDFTYSPGHLALLRQRAQWFEKLDQPHYCLWWVPTGHIPTVAEGRERLEHYQKHGPTPYSFWFHEMFPASEETAVGV
jgi:hypothetical protein